VLLFCQVIFVFHTLQQEGDIMTLLCNLPLHQQVTYRPPTDEEVTRHEIETVNRLHFQQAEKQAEVDALNLRFEVEVARIRDLKETDCFWSMMQGADIYEGLSLYLQALNTPQSRRMFEDLCQMRLELGFTYWFSEQRIDHRRWGEWEKEDPWEFLFFQDSVSFTEIYDEESEFFD
jgi:hypothetical protein